MILQLNAMLCHNKLYRLYDGNIVIVITMTILLYRFSPTMMTNSTLYELFLSISLYDDIIVIFLIYLYEFYVIDHKSYV